MQHLTYVPDHIYLPYTRYKHICAFKHYKHNEKLLIYLTKMSVQGWGDIIFHVGKNIPNPTSLFRKKIIANK